MAIRSLEEGRATRLGWTYLHVAVDDHSRLAYVEELTDEHPATTIGFVHRAIAFYATHDVETRRLLTDNGTPYRSRAFAAAAAEVQIRHLRTRPYPPRTNGKAEAMVKILINGWRTRGPTPQTLIVQPPSGRSSTSTITSVHTAA